MKKQIEDFELVDLENGLVSLRCTNSQETFHPGIGPAEEARILHVEQQALTKRAQNSKNFILWDVGLGAAANAIAAITTLRKELPADASHPVIIQSFDKSTRPLEFALKNAQALGYIVGFEKEIAELLIHNEVKISENIIWKFHQGDFCSDIETLSMRAPDAIFYDPYSSKSNGEMWSLDHFSKIYQRLDPQRPCLLTNYTASTYLRVTLLLAGFYVGYGTQIHKKLQTTIAANSLDLLSRPLDKEWLTERVSISHSAAPLRDLPHKIAPISKADYLKLCQHPQFK
jgi:hypothetical protein